MRTIRTIFLFLFVLWNMGTILSESTLPDDENPSVNFPKNFSGGVLNWGVDCEHFIFHENGTFSYKFTGDCKGWGRTIKGQWKKENDRLLLSAKMIEGPKEENDQCGGSYYHTNTAKEKKECIKKYKSRILKNFQVYPAIFELSGHVVLGKDDNAIVTIKTLLKNNPKLKDKPGFLQIEGDSFGQFDRH
ncbi:hypothetical protein P3G55_14765 [Leptospira sp. 96542]|nr:hypothetical protein [Leptospira sp. 96542]